MTVRDIQPERVQPQLLAWPPHALWEPIGTVVLARADCAVQSISFRAGARAVLMHISNLTSSTVALAVVEQDARVHVVVGPMHEWQTRWAYCGRLRKKLTNPARRDSTPASARAALRGSVADGRISLVLTQVRSLCESATRSIALEQLHPHRSMLPATVQKWF